MLEVDLYHGVLGFDHVASLIGTLPFSSAAGAQEGTMGPGLPFPRSLPCSEMTGSKAAGEHLTCRLHPTCGPHLAVTS